MIDQTMWDIFISHASEDKVSFVQQLEQALSKKGLKVWYDDNSLTLGDSLRRSIDNGLRNARFGIVVLSKHFFAKEWPQKELDALVAREVIEGKVIIPVWHKLSRLDIVKYSPILADRVAVSSENGVNFVAKEIIRSINNIKKRHSRKLGSEAIGVNEHDINHGDYFNATYFTDNNDIYLNEISHLGDGDEANVWRLYFILLVFLLSDSCDYETIKSCYIKSLKYRNIRNPSDPWYACMATFNNRVKTYKGSTAIFFEVRCIRFIDPMYQDAIVDALDNNNVRGHVIEVINFLMEHREDIVDKDDYNERLGAIAEKIYLILGKLPFDFAEALILKLLAKDSSVRNQLSWGLVNNLENIPKDISRTILMTLSSDEDHDIRSITLAAICKNFNHIDEDFARKYIKILWDHFFTLIFDPSDHFNVLPDDIVQELKSSTALWKHHEELYPWGPSDES